MKGVAAVPVCSYIAAPVGDAGIVIVVFGPVRLITAVTGFVEFFKSYQIWINISGKAVLF